MSAPSGLYIMEIRQYGSEQGRSPLERSADGSRDLHTEDATLHSQKLQLSSVASDGTKTRCTKIH